ncbi:MAG: hypothetical protein FWC39_13055 [Bacteroidetes bacterium]|nr:hypothetical protein [Bacteroidota bacterium]
MKKTLLHFGLFLALGLSTTLFYACKKDKDNTGGYRITATNVINGSTQIASVKVIAFNWFDEDYDEGFELIAQAPYRNNGFTLTLPATMPDKYLLSIEAAGLQGLQGISISNNNVKLYILDHCKGYDKDDNEIGIFYLMEQTDNSTNMTYWMYVNGDVTIQGERSGIYGLIEKYDLTLKKGWNVVYGNYTESFDGLAIYTITSKKPSGVDCQWNFLADNSYLASATIKSAENTKSVFSKLKECK